MNQEYTPMTIDVYDSTRGEAVTFKVRSNSPIKLVATSFAQRQGMPNGVTIYIDGSPVQDLNIPCEVMTGANRVSAVPN